MKLGQLISISLFSDIDECNLSGLSHEYKHLAHKCHGDANCTNTKGSYNCGCQEGYRGSGEKCEGELDLNLNALHSKGLVLLSWKGEMSE